MVFGYAEHSDLASEFRLMDLTHWTPYVGYLKRSGLKFYGVLIIIVVYGLIISVYSTKILADRALCSIYTKQNLS